jgi:hypothetical protein
METSLTKSNIRFIELKKTPRYGLSEQEIALKKAKKQHKTTINKVIVCIFIFLYYLSFKIK